MKFKAYLNEGRSVSIEKENAIKLIQNNCMKNYKFFLNKKEWLYRGIDYIQDNYLIVDSNKGKPRTSANTRSNHYTLLMDNLPSWKKYPKRSRSIICSSSMRSADSYGSLYIVIPYDNTNVGVAPDGDIWFSFKFGLLHDFNEFLDKIFRKYHFRVGLNDYKSLEKALIEVNKSGVENKDQFGIFKQDRDIMKYLNEIMSPEYNDFKLGLKNIKHDREVEVWVQGSSILIREDIFYGMMDEI